MFEQQQDHVNKEQKKQLVPFFFYVDIIQQILKSSASKCIPLHSSLQKPQLTNKGNNLHPPNGTSKQLLAFRVIFISE